MEFRKSGLALSVLLLLFMNGCGGSYSAMSTVPAPGTQAAAVTMTVRDTPPAGVTVLALELTVNGAVLNPGSYPLVSNPVKIELKQLETDAAFLGTVSVPAGTYQSITVNLTNPELTILNQSGAAIGGCANNAVCELKPAAAGNVSFSGPPFPISIQNGAPVGFQVDVNVASLVSNTLSLDFNATGAVSIAQLPLPGRPMDHLDDLDDLSGVVQNVNPANSSFTLHTANGDFSVQAGSDTEFEFQNCTTNNFACVQNNLVVKVDIEVMPGGAMIAKKIEFEDDALDDELVGTVFKVDDATHFEMVVLGELQNVSNVSLGNPVLVTLSSPTFEIESDGLSVPSALQAAFIGSSDTSQLLAGQVVEIRPSAVTPGPPIAVTSNRIRLRTSQLTATISGAPVPPNFTVGNLPGLFASAGIMTIGVQTSNATNFEGVAGVSGLADQNSVSLRGLLFKNGGNPPQLIADKVRKR